MLAGTVAALLTLQSGGSPQGAPMTSIFRADDYPIEALRNAEQGTVLYALAIGKDGRPKHCKITQSSGSTARPARS